MDSVDISICIYVCIWHFTFNLATQYLPYDLAISFSLLSGMQASLIVYEIWNSILTKRPLYILIQMCVFFLWIQSETPTPDENEYQVWGFQVYSILFHEWPLTCELSFFASSGTWFVYFILCVHAFPVYFVSSVFILLKCRLFFSPQVHSVSNGWFPTRSWTCNQSSTEAHLVACWPKEGQSFLSILLLGLWKALPSL